MNNNSFSELRRLIQKARKKSIELNDATQAVFDALSDVDLCVPTDAENADDLEQAINCYIQYGEYSIDELLDEIKLSKEYTYGKIKLLKEVNMIDTTNTKWDLSKEEKSVIKWFDDNGYNGKILKQYVSKTVFEISKDGITDKFELPQSIDSKQIKNYMEQFQKNWDVLCELKKLRQMRNQIR